MFKKTIGLLVVFSLLIGTMIPMGAFAEPSSDKRIIPIIVNGYKVRFPDTEPFINTDGRTMVPVRFISEQLGAEVSWEADTQTAIIGYNGKVIRMPVDSKVVMVDGKEVELDTAAELYDGRTMVPIRFVSEVLGSEVLWDEGAHSVQINDMDYQRKIASGEVELDPWGREIAEIKDGRIMLTDLKDYGLYDRDLWFIHEFNEKFINDEDRYWDFKKYADEWRDHISRYYAAQLNLDYRTINKEKFTNTLMNHLYYSNMGDYYIREAEKVIGNYVDWVKENKVIVEGHADPEMSQAYYIDGSIFVPTYFKFKVVSAVDTSQTFIDNRNPSDRAFSEKVKRETWYGGYSYIILGTNYANYQYKHYLLRSFENMFLKYHSEYEELVTEN